jgi:uncharacterized protein (DUF1501 family)
MVGTGALITTIRDMRLINASLAANDVSGYKALVCVFLNGGNDANNLIIPTIPAEYDSYANIRTGILAIPNTDGGPATARALNSLTPDGHTYGIHPACPGLHRLFNDGKAATVFNVGTLVYPMTRAQYTANSVPKPPQLFSHSDQLVLWQTSVPDKPPTTGWGGRVADLLNDTANPSGKISFATSIAGTNTWQRGIVNQQYNVSNSQAIDFTGGPAGNYGGGALGVKQELLNMMGLTQSNLQGKAYAAAVDHALREAAIVNNATASFAPDTQFVAPTGDPLLTAGTALFPTQVTTPNGGATFTSTLSAQLKMVARLIEAGSRGPNTVRTTDPDGTGLNMRRQIFFVQVGGYDTHTNQTNTVSGGVADSNVIIGSQANLFAELSRALYGFYRAMEILGLQDSVTAFTMSDFGRTFPSNGQGSDHGWGSHHIVVGGAVNGQRTYGTFPVLTINGPDDTSTGRWIPTMAVDQYSSAIASWFGVDNANLNTIFPNLGRFAAPPALMKAS